MSDTPDRDVAFIRALAEIMKDNDLSEVEVKREYGDDDELEVRLSKTPAALPTMAYAPPPPPAPAATAPPTAGPAGGEEATAPVAAESGQTVTSPMVGTVYLSPEPGADPFVSVGASVSEGDPILIIEAMKTMNQIPAPRSGRIARILVENAEPVEFGAPLIVID